MSDFFKTHILEQIKKNEWEPAQIDNFISVEECRFLLEYFRNLRNKSVGKSIFVEREESTKIFFKLDQIPEIAKLYEKINKWPAKA